MEQKTVFEIRAILPKEATEDSKVISTREERATKEKPIRQSEDIATPDLSGGFKAAIGTAATIYATSQMVINPLVREYANKAAISGDFVQAENIQRKQNQINQYASLGFEIATVVAAFAVSRPLGVVTLIGSVTNHAQSGISRNQRNHVMRATNNIDNFITSHESIRFIDIKAGR